MDRWLALMSEQAGFACERTSKATAALAPRIRLAPRGEPPGELRVQVPTAARWTLTVNGVPHACTCRDSPTAPGSAAYVECARPDAPVRACVSPGDEVHVRLDAAWEDTRGAPQTQAVAEGCFTVPDQPHKMGAPGYNVYVEHLDAMAYFCVGNVGTPEAYVTEILSFHMTLVY